MDEIISVSQYLDGINKILKTEKAKIIGEVSGFQEYPGRNYLFFSIKDSKDQSTIKCFMWKRDYTLSGVNITDGLEVIITAYPNIYKPNGGLTMQVEAVEMVGEGALQIAYEKLKNKLNTEGLFLESRKKALPEFPHRIGVITSKSGAVINDFLTNIGKFGYEILFVDSKVEGQDAIKDLISAIETLKKREIDVLVIMRGGGSLESFQAFNNEILVRLVASLEIPTITGIGHDKDLPLVSMVSDKNVSTPTAVANLLNSTWSNALSEVNLAEQKIFSSLESGIKDVQYQIENSDMMIQTKFSSIFDVFKDAEKTMQNSMFRIESAITKIKDVISQQSKDINKGFTMLTSNLSDYLVNTEKYIMQESPERLLSKGYSIIKHNGKILRSVKDVSRGEELDISVSDGIIHSQII